MSKGIFCLYFTQKKTRNFYLIENVDGSIKCNNNTKKKK